MQSITHQPGNVRPKIRLAKHVTLSTYFPAGTRFFYGYPAGEDSGFLNRVGPEIEELVAARPICCAGRDVFIVNFAATTTPAVDTALLKTAGIPRLPRSQTITLPTTIDTALTGAARNTAVKEALATSIRPHSLVMAQPYTDVEMEATYQIPPSLTAWLNDKHNMASYISAHLIPTRQGSYKSGAALKAAAPYIHLPVVVKVSASSSGDGVYICRRAEDFAQAVAALENIEATILVEQYIEVVKNYAIHFGIPFSAHRPIDILGINEQITSEDGEFIGGVITSREIPAELTEAVEQLRESILPKIRAKGWYGIGGFDVLLDKAGNYYFIDCNFRMTGMSAFHFLVANDNLPTPLVSFSGSFEGNQADFEQQILPLIQPNGSERMAKLIALSHNDNTWRCNGAVWFDTPEQQQAHATTLLKHGLQSAALEKIANG